MTLYGIPNCDTVKKAQTWLKNNNRDFVFHDYRKESIGKTILQRWVKEAGLELLLNKKSTTWRGLSPEQQALAATKAGAIQLMQEHPSLIKRPVLEKNGAVVAVGFDEKKYAEL